MTKVSTRLRAPNGMNLSQSMYNPDSRANRVIDYLRSAGPATKAQILHDVFGRVIVEWPMLFLSSPRRKNKVTRGWGAYLFVLLQSHGYIRRVRNGNIVTYEAM